MSNYNMSQKEYFLVKLEVLAPTTLSYRILAESPEEAAALAAEKQGQEMQNAPKIAFHKMKKIQSTVYNAGTSMIQYIKKY